jgi:hypothetical protein
MNYRNRNIDILWDSHAAITALSNHWSPQNWSETTTGQGIDRNEMADQLAKLGSEHPFIGPESACSISTWVAKKVVRDWPPLWSSGQSSWLQIQRSGFDSWCYQISWKVGVWNGGSLSLVSTIDELLERKSSSSGLENRDYGCRGPVALTWHPSIRKSWH